MADQIQTAQPAQNFDQIFDQAWAQNRSQPQQQAPALVSGDQQFDTSFDKAFEQSAAGQRSIPAQILAFPQSLLSGMSSELSRMEAGIEGSLGNLFDPDAKYSQQNTSQLVDGIGKAQERLNELQKKTQDQGPGGYSSVNAGVEAAGIEMSIRAMRRNLERLSGQPEQGSSWAKDIGDWLLNDQQARLSLARQEAGEEPMQGSLNQALGNVLIPPALTRETGSAKFARQLGSQAAYAVPDVIGTALGGPLLGGALSTAAFYGGTWQSAQEEAQSRPGMDPATAIRYANAAAAFAPLQWATMHSVLGPFLAGDSGLIVSDVLKNIVKNYGLFAATGEGQNVYNNVVAQLSGMDPNRKWNDNIGQATVNNAATMSILGAIPEIAPFMLRRMVRTTGEDIEQGGSKPGQPNTNGQTTVQPVSGEAQLSELEASMRAGASLPQSPEAVAQPQLNGAAQEVRDALPSTPDTRALPPSSWAAELGRMAAEWRKGAGDRLYIKAATPDQLPMRYRAALRSQGTEPEDYTTFVDKRDGTLWLNPRTATPELLTEAVVRNWSKYGFADKTNVKTLDSWAEAADNPNVARLLLRDPNADTTTHELYDRDTGITYINVPKHLEQADPVQSLFGTMAHVIGGHQGVTYIGGDDLEGFLQRRYQDFRVSGMGDHIWSRYGLTMDQAADQLGLLRDANGDLTPKSQQRLADETMSRYAQQFNPRQLDELPTILQRMNGMVRDALQRYQGMNLTSTDTFKMIQNGWRYSSPKQLPDAQASQTAKGIIKAHEPHAVVAVRGADPHTEELHRQSIVTSPNAAVPTSRGDTRSIEELRAASDRVGNIPGGARNEYPEGKRAQHAPNLLPTSNGAELESRVSRDGKYIVDATRPESATGPYGLAPSWPARPGANGQGRALDQSRATLAEYLQRLALSNKYFNAGHQLEGYERDPGTGWWRVVSSRPRIDGDNFRPATTEEIAGYMADRGFHQIDERTFYNPSERVLVLQADGGNLAVDDATGEIVPHNVAPFNVDGPMARALDGVTSDPMRRAGLDNADAVQKWLDAYSGMDPLTQAKLIQQAAEDHNTLRDLRNKANAGTLTPEEQAQMDAIEYGPLLRRDIDEELGPGSPNEPPLELLKRAIEDQRRAMPREEYERVHAARAASDPNTPPLVQAFNAAPDQLLAEKGSAKWRRGVIDNLKRQYEGNLTQIANDLIGGRFAQLADGGYEPAIYGELTRDIRARRAAAVTADDQGAVATLDAAQMKLDDWANKFRTTRGKDLQAWQDVYYSKDGLYSQAATNFRQQATRDVRNQPGFQQSVDAVRDTVKATSREMPDNPDIKNATRIAQEFQDRQEGGKRAIDWAESIGRELVQQALGARMLGPRPPDLSTVYRMMRSMIEGQVREHGIKLDRPTGAKLSASDTIAAAMRAWPFLRNVQDWVSAEGERVFANDPEMAQQFRQLYANSMEVPFNKAMLGRFAREEGVDIGQLLKAHRSQTGDTIDSLTDFLTRQSDLTPEQSQAVSKAVNNFITQAIAERRRAEFDRIIDRANAGKPVEKGRGTTVQRLLDLVHMGAFSDDQVANALAPVYGYKGYDPAFDTEMNRIADQLEADRQAGRDGFQTEATRMRMNRLIANYAQFKFGDYRANLFKGNVVATIPGHEIGFINEMFLGFDSLLRRLLLQERLKPSVFAATLKEVAHGFAQGAQEAPFIFRTGTDPGRFKTIDDLRADKDLKTTVSGGFFEGRPTTRFFQERAPLLKGLGQAIDWHMIGWGRAISALHNMIYSGFGRSEAYLSALQWARRNPDIGPNRAEAWANEALNGTRAQRRAFEDRADREGLTGLSKARRVNELFEQQLPEEVLQAADWAGTKANAFQDPKGMPGMVAAFVGRAAQKWPELHFVMPIVRLPMNLLNNAIDTSPLGLARYIGWGKGPEGYLTRRGELVEKYTPAQMADLKQELLWRGVTGTALMAGLAALTTQRGPDGKFPIQINGAGPVDKQKLYQLMDQGWQPHSIQIGNLSIPYEAVPGWLVLEALGNYQDSQRYLDNPDASQAFSYTLGRTWTSILDRSTLRGLSDLLDSFRDIGSDPTNPGNQTKLMRMIARMETGSIPFVGASYVRQIYQQYLDDKLYQARGWGAITRDLPFVAGIGSKPELNVLGEPVHMQPLTHRFWSSTPDDEVWKFLADHEGLWLPKVQMVKKAQAVKLFGEPLTDDQKYDYTALRGQHLRQLLFENLDDLKAETDPDELDDKVKAFGKQAYKDALEDLVDGVKPSFGK